MKGKERSCCSVCVVCVCLELRIKIWKQLKAQNQVWKQLRVYKIILSFGVSPKNKIPKSLALFRGHLLLFLKKTLALFTGHLVL